MSVAVQLHIKYYKTGLASIPGRKQVEQRIVYNLFLSAITILPEWSLFSELVTYLCYGILLVSSSNKLLVMVNNSQLVLYAYTARALCIHNIIMRLGIIMIPAWFVTCQVSAAR